MYCSIIFTIIYLIIQSTPIIIEQTNRKSKIIKKLTDTYKMLLLPHKKIAILHKRTVVFQV